MPKKRCISDRRRKVLATLAALPATLFFGLRSAAALPVSTSTTSAAPGRRRITQLFGSVGWPESEDDVRMWKNMGLSWGRDSVGPGFSPPPIHSLEIDMTGPGYDNELPPIILRNNRNGIGSLLMLGYTPEWNASVAGDIVSAPKDVRYWERYVEAVVRRYSTPPFNLKYFQIWNEASGPLAGGDPQSSFWHGPRFNGDLAKSKPYESAMRDYVERIHIPAARIIRKYHAYVVYGGWPDQGGLDNYLEWLEYRSPTYGTRMLDWVDYLDIHYLGIGDMELLYRRYVANGKARGIWQTEIGDRYMANPHSLPSYLFELAAWALDREWNDPDKYVTMIYHWDGYDAFRLTHRGPPKRTYNVSGRSLITLRKTVSGALSPFLHTLKFDPKSEGKALYSDDKIVLQVSAPPGWRSVEVGGLAAPASGRFDVAFVDAITGAKQSQEHVKSAWTANTLSIRFEIPRATNGPVDEAPRHLAYLLVTSLA
jgi:hypothetical protein